MADLNIQSETTSFVDLGKQMWSYLTGKGAAINYEFVDMIVEVPRETGPSAPRAVWRLGYWISTRRCARSMKGRPSIRWRSNCFSVQRGQCPPPRARRARGR